MKKVINLTGLRLVEGDPNEVGSNELLVIKDPSTGKVQDIQRRGSSGKLESVLSHNMSFTISPTPVDAKVIINGVVTSTVNLPKDSYAHWEVSKRGFVTQRGRDRVDSNTERNIILSKVYEAFIEKSL